MANVKITDLTALSGAVVGADLFEMVDDVAGTPASRKVTATVLQTFIAGLVSQAVTPGGRLTLETGVPVSTTDQTAKTSIFYTPFVHNVIPLWDGTNWTPTVFTEVTQALGTITSGRPYDVFGFLNAGALNTEILSWTSDTARATAVTLQDGRYCKSGDKTRLLLGTFRTTATTTTEDSSQRRFVDNVYNQVPRRMTVNVTGETTTSTTLSEVDNAGADTFPRLGIVVALPKSATFSMSFSAQTTGGSTATTARYSFIVDSTTGSDGDNVFTYDVAEVPNAVRYTGAGPTPTMAAGYHYLSTWHARSAGDRTVTTGTIVMRGTYPC